MIEPSRPAFPVPDYENVPKHAEGVSKREFFAALAMIGYLRDGSYSTAQSVAEQSITMADKLIQELNR